MPPPSSDDDATLLALVQRGDEQAMAALFDRYSKVVYSVALRVLRDPASAEDVLQEIFMQIWRSPDGFVAARGSLGGWLAVVSRNRSIDALRRKRPTEQVEGVALASSFNLGNESERNIMIEKARTVIHTLPSEQRKTLEMAFFDGFDPFRDRRNDRRPAGHGKDEDTHRVALLEKGLSIMIPVKHIDPDDIALYAMQLLPPDETEEMSLHLQHSAEARRVLSEIYSDLAIFAHSAEMNDPPALARQRLMKGVAREKKAVPVDPLAGSYAPRATPILFEEEVVKRSFGSRVMPWVGWALAAGLGAFSATEYMQQQQLKSTLAASTAKLQQTQSQAELANVLMQTMKDPSAVHFTLTGSDLKPPPQGRVTYVRENGSLVLTASNLNPLPPTKTYELWLIPVDSPVPIPAGTFRPDSNGFATVMLPELPKGVSAKAFGVTIEDGDGSATPTMPIVLKGTAS